MMLLEVMHVNPAVFGPFLKESRLQSGMTQEQLARQLQVTSAAVSKWERGLSYPDVTLLEPLASALGLGVEELMACRRQAAESGEEDPMKNLLTISGESLQRERRRSWGRLAGVLVLLAVTGAVIAWNALHVTEMRCEDLVLKETVDGVDYIYLQEGDHLLKLRCKGDVDFDSIVLKTEYGEGLVYDLECRWNRLTYEGTVTACTANGMINIGSAMSQIGSAMGLDYNPETGDALFGYDDAAFQYKYIYPNPDGEGFLYTYDFWRGDGETWNAERLLTVRDCRTFAAADWDGDGVTELLVRTRWKEKPYMVYDIEAGTITENWLDTLEPEFAELLMTVEEQDALLQEQLRREGVDPEEDMEVAESSAL